MARTPSVARPPTMHFKSRSPITYPKPDNSSHPLSMTPKIENPKTTTHQRRSLFTARTWLIISALAIFLVATIAIIDQQGMLHKLDLQTFDLLVATQHPAPPSHTV